MDDCKYEYNQPSFFDRASEQLCDTEAKIYRELLLCHTNCGSVPKGLASFFKQKATTAGMNKLRLQNADWDDLNYQEQHAVLDHCSDALLSQLGFNPKKRPLPRPRPKFFSLDPEGF